jgi:hypothetical protein
MALQYVEAQQLARPDHADWYASLADLYQRKLWHQLTLKLDRFLQLQPAQVRSSSPPPPPPPPPPEMVLRMGSQMWYFSPSRATRATLMRFDLESL